MKTLIFILSLPVLCFASENNLERFFDLPVSERYSYKEELEHHYHLVSGDRECYQKLVFKRYHPSETSPERFENRYSLFLFSHKGIKRIFSLERGELSDVHYREDPVRKFDSRDYRYLKIKSNKIKYKFKEEKVKSFGYVNHTYYPAKSTKITLKKKRGGYEVDYKFEIKKSDYKQSFKCLYN
ncbi:MAG: hypothetical protein CME62_15105 [Halobacteriovoraceae bacterium]|nr:hypothetical protein [Halobacteriovoraceae bacterium]|tara:strand:- start:21181 stop:21729 length:549 start_codon:yes stop_codon:yes gene_type:complete